MGHPTWRETNRIEGKELNLKLFMLLALTASSRASGIHYLHIRFIVNTGYKVAFHFHRLHTSWRKGKRLPFLSMHMHIHLINNYVWSKH